MAQDIDTDEAKRQRLAGCDVYIRSHLLYHDDFNRDIGIVLLNMEAMKAFLDTILISRRSALESEQRNAEQWIAKGGHLSGIPFEIGHVTYAMADFENYEHLKIACGFELHLKARLLSGLNVVHKINNKIPEYKRLADEQKDRPIQKQELLSINSFRFNGTQNYLPGIGDESLSFSSITTKKKYKEALRLPAHDLDIINDYRLLRNQIHLPGDIVDTPHLRSLQKLPIDFLLNFINTEIVAWSNELIGKHGFRLPKLTPIR